MTDLAQDRATAPGYLNSGLPSYPSSPSALLMRQDLIRKITQSQYHITLAPRSACCSLPFACKDSIGSLTTVLSQSIDSANIIAALTTESRYGVGPLPSARTPLPVP